MPVYGKIELEILRRNIPISDISLEVMAKIENILWIGVLPNSTRLYIIV